MADIKPEMLEAARLAGVQGLPDPEEPEVSDDNDQHLDDTANLDTSSDKGVKPDSSESDNDQDDLSQFPEEFFGTNIREYAEEHGVEAATAFHNALKDANRVSNRRMQEIAELRKTAEADAAKDAATRRVTDEASQEPPVELSDEDLLTQFGLDPAVLQYEELGKPLVALVKSQTALQTQLANLTKEAESQAWETDFFGTLDTLQKESGTITDESGVPVDRVDLEEFAIENNIYDPAALYWRLMGPVLASKPVPPKPATPARRDLKRSLSGPKRKAGAAGSVTGQPPKTLREHFDAAKEAAGVTGDQFDL